AEAAETAINEARGLAPDAVPADWDAAPAAAPPAAEEPLLTEEAPPLPTVEEEIPLEVEEGGLEAGMEAEAELPDLDLGVEAAPAEPADESLSSESADAPSEELSLAGEEELPLDQPAEEEAPSEELSLGEAGLDLEAAPASPPEAEAFEEPAPEPEPEPPPPPPPPTQL